MPLRSALLAGRTQLAEILLKRGAKADLPNILDDLKHPEKFTTPEQKIVFGMIEKAAREAEAKNDKGVITVEPLKEPAASPPDVPAVEAETSQSVDGPGLKLRGAPKSPSMIPPQEPMPLYGLPKAVFS